jgi:cob(I)alamin adenosyltransferase
MLGAAQVARLDRRLAHYNADLPRLAEFILPGGARTAALAHVCRTVCRRAERTLVALAQAGGAQAVGTAARQYVNRLSDLLFVLARVLNRASGAGDVLWQPGKNRGE